VIRVEHYLPMRTEYRRTTGELLRGGAASSLSAVHIFQSRQLLKKLVKVAPDIGNVVDVFLYQGTNAGDVIVMALYLRRSHVVPLRAGPNGLRQIPGVSVDGVDVFDQMVRLHFPGMQSKRLKSSARDLFGVGVNLAEVVLKLIGTVENTLEIVRYALEQFVVLLPHPLVSQLTGHMCSPQRLIMDDSSCVSLKASMVSFSGQLLTSVAQEGFLLRFSLPHNLRFPPNGNRLSRVR
jgi:hypothetical protein